MKKHEVQKALGTDFIKNKSHFQLYCTNFEAFCKTFLSKHISTSWNEMHRDFFHFAKSQERGRKHLILSPRGSAKTTLIALCYALWQICYGKETYILILSSTKPLAVQKSKDIQHEIQKNEPLKWAFGLNFEDKKVSKERFVIKSDFGRTFVHSQGFMGQIRGTKEGASRPSLVICDDITHSEHVFSDEQRDKARRQFRADVQMANEPSTNFILIGTVLHANDLLSELYKSALWKSHRYQAIKKWPIRMDLWERWEDILKNSDNKNREAEADIFYRENEQEMNEGAEVLWPEREGLLYLMKERLDIGNMVFNCEKQLEPFSSQEALFQKIHWFSYTEKEGKMGFYIEKTKTFIPLSDYRWQVYYALDPASGDKKSKSETKKLSDSSRIIVYQDVRTDRLFVFRDITNRDSPSKLINEMYDLHKAYQFEKMGVEENLFQDLFGTTIELKRKLLQHDTGKKVNYLPIYGLWQNQNKERRIYGFEPRVASGQILFCRTLSSTARTQLQDYPRCSNDDFLDAVEIATKITNTNYKHEKMRFQYE